MSVALLREAISAILAETKAQPLPAKQVVAKLRQQLANYIASPEVWEGVVQSEMHNIPDKATADKILRGHLGEALQKGIKVIVGSALVEVDFSKQYRTVRKPLNEWMNMNSGEFFKRRGWFMLIGKLNGEEDQDGNPRQSTRWTFSSNYSERITDVPGVLYHTTRAENVEHILRKGLFPRNGASKGGHSDRSTPPRVYVTASHKEALQLSLAFGLGDDVYMTGTSDGHVILQIDTSKLEKGTKFYVDPEMSNLEGNSSMWTYSRIPANAISIDPGSVDDFEEYKVAMESMEAYR